MAQERRLADGSPWQRRVRRITMGAAGVAGVSALALTIGLAQAAPPAAGATTPTSDPIAGGAGSAPGAPGSTSSRTDPWARTPAAAPPSTTDRAAAPNGLAPPLRPPAAGPGWSQARSGGS